MKVRILIPGSSVFKELEDNQAERTFRELASRLLNIEPAGVINIKPPEVLQEIVQELVENTTGCYPTPKETTCKDELAPVQPAEPADAVQPEPNDMPIQKYKGFLYIQCEECKEVKGFCAKEPISVNRCKCGNQVELKDLVPLYVNCECGRRSKYMTNVPDELFDIKCINCGAPVSVRWNSHKAVYETIN